MKLDQQPRLRSVHLPQPALPASSVLLQRVPLQAPPGAAPDVAEQLLQFCWHSSQCTPVLLRRQVDEQAQQLAQTQQQLSQKQQELSQTQQQLGQTQHELINTQQELAEARQQVVTLQQQVVSTSAAAGS